MHGKKSPDYKYVPYDIRKRRERHHVLQQHLGATPPLILGFHPSKRHAALIVFLRSGQHCSCLYLGITRTEAFFMASNASYLDVRSMIFSRFIMLLLFTIYEYQVFSMRSCLILS